MVVVAAPDDTNGVAGAGVPERSFQCRAVQCSEVELASLVALLLDSQRKCEE